MTVCVFNDKINCTCQTHLPVWWNGRHQGLKIPCRQLRTGSSPVTGTKKEHPTGVFFFGYPGARREPEVRVRGASRPPPGAETRAGSEWQRSKFCERSASKEFREPQQDTGTKKQHPPGGVRKTVLVPAECAAGTDVVQRTLM